MGVDFGMFVYLVFIIFDQSYLPLASNIILNISRRHPVVSGRSGHIGNVSSPTHPMDRDQGRCQLLVNTQRLSQIIFHLNYAHI